MTSPDKDESIELTYKPTSDIHALIGCQSSYLLFPLAPCDSDLLGIDGEATRSNHVGKLCANHRTFGESVDVHELVRQSGPGCRDREIISITRVTAAMSSR